MSERSDKFLTYLDSVKAVDTLKIALPPLSSGKRTATTIASTISSDGKVRVYDLAEVPSTPEGKPKELTPIAEYDSKGSRLTCMAMADGEMSPHAANGKRKREDVDVEHGGEESSDDEIQSAGAAEELEAEEVASEEAEDEDEDDDD